jgi:hypothetical protein
LINSLQRITPRHLAYRWIDQAYKIKEIGSQWMKTFILSVGAQKCGTTWLYGQFKANKMVNMGFRKEYQF